MYSLLLTIIYLAFISLGLPDSLLGSAWPVIYEELNVPISYAGIITMIIAGGTIVSSLMSDRVTRKFGAGLVTAISVAMTAVALFGFSISNSFILLCLWAVPYGLGAGAVDAALNNYVAVHYASRIHSTPSNFGEENSQAIIGIQMASAYTGATFMPPLFGVIADNINIGLYPAYLIFFAILMLIMSEMLNKTVTAPCID